MREVTDISELVKQLCEKLDVPANWVYRIEIDANNGAAVIYCYKGTEGFCKGHKYVDKDESSRWYGTAAIEPPLDIKVIM